MKMIGNYMKSKLAAAFLAALSLGAGTAVSAQEAGQDQYRLAAELYGHGMFEGGKHIRRNLCRNRGCDRRRL